MYQKSANKSHYIVKVTHYTSNTYVYMIEKKIYSRGNTKFEPLEGETHRPAEGTEREQERVFILRCMKLS